MAKYRTIPRTVEASQFFVNGPDCPGVEKVIDDSGNCPMIHWQVLTANGQYVEVVDGDWIIAEMDHRGYYPVKPDIFSRSYKQCGY